MRLAMCSYRDWESRRMAPCWTSRTAFLTGTKVLCSEVCVPRMLGRSAWSLLEGAWWHHRTAGTSKHWSVVMVKLSWNWACTYVEWEFTTYTWAFRKVNRLYQRVIWNWWQTQVKKEYFCNVILFSWRNWWSDLVNLPHFSLSTN